MKLFHPSPRHAADGQQSILLGTRTLEYQLQRSERRTIGFLISEHGLRVSAPLRINMAEIERAILDKQRWILSKLALREQLTAQKAGNIFLWQDGAQLPFLGASVQLCISHERGLPAVLTADGAQLKLYFATPPTADKVRQRVGTWLQAQAQHLFTQRLRLHAAAMGVQYASLTLSSARTQWGSCSAQGHIRLNWRLIHFQLALIDYVVIHELAHRREMNHSAQFWAHVAHQCPDYKQARLALQQASRALPQGL